MKVRTHSFDDIRKGMESIKEQYGPDTIIMDIKQNNLDGYGWTKRSCEISIAVEDAPATPEEDYLGELRRGTEAVWQYTTKYLTERLGTMESEMIRDRMKTYPLPLKVLFDKIAKGGFNIHLALELVSEVYAEIGHLGENSTKAIFFLKNAIARRIRTYNPASTLEPIVFLGPTGAGKTEAVKKLSKMVSDEGMPVSILAFDPVKKSSYDELRAFSESTGVPFQFTTNPEDLLMKAKRNTGKTLIDLTGQVTIQKQVVEQLKEFKKIIVLPAGARDEKMEQYVRLFQNCNIAGLVFSKLDEEEYLGSLCCNVMKLGRPVCFMTKGTGLNDILRHDKETFSRILIEGAIW
jgi:flagellar biosynthesis GTPase FlhF